MKRLPDVESSYQGELFRKGIHLSSLSIPVAYTLLDKGTVLAILFPLTAVFLLTDIARIFSPPFRKFYHRIFGWLMREHERGPGSKSLNGASYVLLSACICILLFPKVIAITAFSILIVSDTVAALVGRRFGRKPFLAKSREGSAAFFLSAVVVVLVTPKEFWSPAEYLIGTAGAGIGAIVESLPVAIDDNLSIPLAIGGAMWLLYASFLPIMHVS
jgi:dolichol kinase